MNLCFCWTSTVLFVFVKLSAWNAFARRKRAASAQSWLKQMFLREVSGLQVCKLTACDAFAWLKVGTVPVTCRKCFLPDVSAVSWLYNLSVELVLCIPFVLNCLHETCYTFVSEYRPSRLFSVEILLLYFSLDWICLHEMLFVSWFVCRASISLLLFLLN